MQRQPMSSARRYMSALDFELSWLPVRYVLWLELIQYDASGSESSRMSRKSVGGAKLRSM